EPGLGALRGQRVCGLSKRPVHLAEDLAHERCRLAATRSHRAAHRRRGDLTRLLEDRPVLLAGHPHLHRHLLDPCGPASSAPAASARTHLAGSIALRLPEPRSAKAYATGVAGSILDTAGAPASRDR